MHSGHRRVGGSESVCTLGFCDPAARPASKRRVLPAPARGSPAGPRMSSAPGSGCAPAPTCPCPAAWPAPLRRRRGLRRPRGRRGGQEAPWRRGPGGGRLQWQHVSGSLIHLIPCAPGNPKPSHLPRAHGNGGLGDACGRELGGGPPPPTGRFAPSHPGWTPTTGHHWGFRAGLTGTAACGTQEPGCRAGHKRGPWNLTLTAALKKISVFSTERNVGMFWNRTQYT